MSNSQTKTLFDKATTRPDVPKLGRGFEKNFDRPLSHRHDPLSSYQPAEDRGSDISDALGLAVWHIQEQKIKLAGGKP